MKLERFFSTDAMLDDFYSLGIVARHRFGENKAERVVFSRSTDYRGAFFRSPRDWLTTLSAQADRVWTVVLPIFHKAPAILRFRLAGTDKAVAALQEVYGR
jgi:hypothetical protein